ncbi:MAG: hypothetical protein ACR2NR_17495 [Solirubrobacteraceae bacterium]
MTNRSRVVALTLTLMLGGTGVAHAAAPGTLDPSFGSSGTVSIPGAQLFGVAAQSNGDAVVAGQSGAGAAFVQRLSTSGAPDAGFGSGGTATGPSGVARAVALQPDGKVVFAGTSGGMFAMRLNANGTADGSFGSGGVARAFVGSGVANAIAVQPDGKIVVAGSVNPINTRIAVARFNSNGTLDTSFGSGGAEVIDLGLPFAAANGVVLQPDGKIVLVGLQQGSVGYAFFNGLVIRLNSNGTLDTGFNHSGVVSYLAANSGYDTLNAVTIQTDGKIVAAGSDVGGPYAIFLRLNGDGSYDSTFGSGGVAALSSGNFTSSPYGAYGVGIGGGGTVLGAGAVGLNGTDLRAGLWATTATGAGESAFGSGGLVDQQLASEACALAIAPDGSLLVVGQTVNPEIRTNPCTGARGLNGFVSRYVGFGPPPQPVSAPAASTGNAGAITETSATVSGTVNPDGAITSYAFQYGTSTAYGSATAPVSIAAGTANVGVSVPLSGLLPGTTDHYRLQATNSAGTTYGQDAAFTTAVGAPAVTTGSALAGEVSATVHGIVTANGLATTYHVDYGRTTRYGSRGPTARIGASSSSSPITAHLNHLRPRTTYHYLLVAVNAAGSGAGADASFTTRPRLTASVRGVPRSASLTTVISRGLKLKVRCNQSCSSRGSLSVSRTIAGQLRLKRNRRSIAGGAASLRRAGTATLALRLTTAGAAALRRRHRALTVTLRVTVEPAGGGPAVTFKQTVTLRA